MSEKWILTELHSAAYNNDLEYAQERIALGDDVNAIDSKGFTPLHWCAFRSMVGYDPVGVAGLLLENGADPNAKTSNNDSFSVLDWAIDAGNEDVVKLLIEKGADVNLVAGGVTPLMRAAAVGSKEMVELLLHSGADLNLTVGNFTAFRYADYYGHEHLFELLSQS